MARPVCKGFLRSDLSSLRQRIRSQDGILAKMEIRAFRPSIKLAATERHFLNQGSETPIDCQAISLHHQQTIESRSRIRRGRPNSRLRRYHDVSPLELTTMPQHGPYNPGQLVRQGHHHDVGMRPCQQATQPRTEGGPAPCQGRHGGSSAMDQQLAKVFVAPLADTEQSRFSTGRCLAWYEP